jgi:beta-lactam-binding protein with PASTA domain
MKSLTRYMLVIAMVGAMLSSIVGAASAAEGDPYLAAVNGNSAEVVDVTAGPEPIAAGLPYREAAPGVPVPPGGYDVTFTAPSSTSTATGIEAAAQTAQTVVSGFGEGTDAAKAYPIVVTEISAGMAKITVWNATDAPVMVTVGAEPTIEVPPGKGSPTTEVPGDSTTSIDIDGVTDNIGTPPDSYTDVFAVNDGNGVAIATSVVTLMTQLRTELGLDAPGDVEVPNVEGQASAEATASIEAAGLTVGTTSTAPDDTIPADSVISQDPSAGAVVPAGSPVNMVLSTGASTLPVPDVVGQPEGDAQATLEGEGFAVTSTEQSSADVEIGLVISTNPTAGTEVALGTTVEMVVSSGPGEVVVPDIIGMDADEATAAIEAAGLTISVVEDPDNPDPDGVIIKQDPTAGTTVEGGSEVVAQLSPDLGEPWAIVHLDPNRLMTVAGIGMLPDSTVNLSIVDTDITESVAVQGDGSWNAKFDLSDVENDTEFLLVKGTAADTNDYEATFTIPAAGQSTDAPAEETATEDSGFPVWGWILLGVAVIALVLLIVRMVQGNTADEGGTDTGSTDAGGTDAS